MEKDSEREALLERLKALADSFGLKGVRIAMLCPYYPTLKNPYVGGFFHSLARVYSALFSLSVFVLDNKEENYVYENIKVERAFPLRLVKKVLSFAPDILLVMGAHTKLISIANLIDKLHILLKVTFPLGGEVFNKLIPTSWPDDNEWEKVIKLPYRMIPRRWHITELSKMLKLRRYLKKQDQQGGFIVHHSKWINKMCEMSTLYKPKNTKIIPYPVDTTIFKFQPREGKVEKLICVRPLSPKRDYLGRKYAVDLVIRASRGKYETHIYGEGEGLYQYMALARKLKANVKFFPKFFTHKELAELYLQYDMGLMLSRLDSQGVSACEMQATGLPVISSAVSAIPEFATGGTILIKNTEVDKVEEIIDDINERGILEELSWKAHKGIVEKCGIEKVMREHLLLFHQLLSERKLL
jgi:glycosyltransferase involved in cell wall biosynthesis